MRPQVISSIPYSDIWGSDDLRRTDLEATIAQMDWRDVVTTSGGISSIAWRRGIEDADYARIVESFVADQPLYGQALILKLRADDSRVLFTDESLLAVMRLAIAAANTSDALSNREFRDVFVRAVLMANQIIHDEINPLIRTGKPRDLMASEVRSKSSILENPHVLLARTAAFFEWSSDPNRPLSQNELSVEADLKTFTGLTPMEYAAGAYAMLSRTAVIQQPSNIQRDAIFFTLDKWLTGLKKTRIPKRWIKANSVSLKAMRLEWKREPSLSYAAAGSLWRYPVVRARDSLFVPSPKLVANAMGDGTYFALLDGYKGKDKHKFTRLYGEFFEDYIAELIVEGYAARQGTSTTRAFKYNRGKEIVDSSDVIVTENNDVIFIEIVAKRISLIDSVVRLNPASIERDIRRGILKKAKQLHDNIDDYRQGRLLPGVARPKGQRLFPVIVSPKDWPRIQILTGFWPAEQAKNKLLLDAEPLEILDADEIETLQPMLRNGICLAELLDRKNRPPGSGTGTRMQSMHDYLIIMERTILPNDTDTRQRGEKIAAELIDMVRTWAI